MKNSDNRTGSISKGIQSSACTDRLPGSNFSIFGMSMIQFLVSYQPAYTEDSYQHIYIELILISLIYHSIPNNNFQFYIQIKNIIKKKSISYS